MEREKGHGRKEKAFCLVLLIARCSCSWNKGPAFSFRTEPPKWCSQACLWLPCRTTQSLPFQKESCPQILKVVCCWADSHLSLFSPAGLVLAVCQALENTTSALSGESCPLSPLVWDGTWGMRGRERTLASLWSLSSKASLWWSWCSYALVCLLTFVITFSLFHFKDPRETDWKVWEMEEANRSWSECCRSIPVTFAHHSCPCGAWALSFP